MRIVFLGTPDFAVPTLNMLIEKGYDIVGVITQPDRPKGRTMKLQAPPVKELALKYGLPVYQYDRISRGEGADALRSLAPDLMVTAAFGQILSADNLSVPTIGCINVHGSLLPKYRGAAPIQWAVIDGEKKTGVTTMFTDVGLDTGDILLKRDLEIGENETAGELFDRIAVLGAKTLIETIELLQKGELKRIPQDHEQATKCKMISKADARIDWTKSAQEIHNLVRGMNPWPVAFCELNGETVKIYKTRLAEGKGASGQILSADPKEGLIVAAGEGAIEIIELQESCCKRMEAKAYLCGNPIDNSGTSIDASGNVCGECISAEARFS